MANKYVPDDLTLTEAACVNWTLARIKAAILCDGVPSGKAIDRALEETMRGTIYSGSLSDAA